MAYRCCAFPLATEAIARYQQQLGLATSAEALHHLAQAITLHPMWQDLAQGLCVVRTQPTPLLAILGTFSPKLWERMRLQQGHLTQACQRLRFVSYADALGTCERLADQLRDALGTTTLRSLQFYGIPRGGLIVLGLLSYVLELRPDQLYPGVSDRTPLVVVDDCALSGARFRQVLQQHPHRELVFATLYAHPNLKRAIATQESQVLHCLSGEDLGDHGAAVLGADYPRWQAENLGRLAGHRYWLGLPDYLCFPWNEPDHLLWNPISAQLEQSWAIMPPSHCLKHRECPSKLLPIQAQVQSNGWVQLTPEVVVGDTGSQIWLGHWPTGELFGLTGKAAVFWRTLVQSQGLEDALQTLSQQYPEPTLHADVTTLLHQLQRQQIVSITELPDSFLLV